MRKIIFLLFSTLLFAEPKLDVSSETWDFGTLKEGEKAEHVFILKNVGDDTLVISKVRATCGCTATLLEDSIIPPGGETKLKSSLRTMGMSGVFHKYIYVYSNDFENPRISLVLTGKVQREPAPRIRVWPTIVRLNRISPGDEERFVVSVQNYGELPLYIYEVKTSPGIQLEFMPEDSIPPKSSINLNFKYVPTEPGPIEELITIRTNDPRISKIYVFVRDKEEKRE